MRLLWWPMVALLVITMTACSDKSDDPPSPFAGCDALTAAPPSAAPISAAAPATTLPDLRLSCFTGESEIALRELRGPAVINLWASWCGPCRDELPVMQRLADRAEGRLTVLGVDTGDSREAGSAFATDAGVRMPTLFDTEKKLLNALGQIRLPITVFVDSAGRSTVHPLPLDARSLSEQVRKNTGVTVTP
ncbi:MAG: TlpA disulfide reductase family protein [Actinoplanes sp.]